MKNKEKLFPDELKHLAFIQSKLEQAIHEARESVDRLDRQYTDARNYMSESRGEIDPHEMFQNELLLKQTDHTGAFASEVCSRLRSLKDSPYFARIDFCEKGNSHAETYYIGRFSFRHGYELLILDWRAPISGMFYDYETGPAGFDAPSGRIEGTLTKKRQFSIKYGVLEYTLETSAAIQDDVLQKELSHTSSEKMKTIISTIQKEQNQIIRDEHTETLIIQGAAGSGKTSIALHRIAFLLYRFKDRLNSRNVTILSPNKVFGDYISNVIPELGEEPIYELDFSDLAEIQLGQTIEFEPEKDPLECRDEAYAQRVRYKSTLDFLKLMDKYICEMQETIFVPDTISFGNLTAEKEWILKRFHAYIKHPVKQRLKMTADDIHDRFQTDGIMEDELPGTNQIYKKLTSMLLFKSPLALYKNFYKKMKIPEMLVFPGKKTLEWADVYPFLYLSAAYEGLTASNITKHLVIDEMQDYTPIQYAVINFLFPCQKTILGDFAQSVHPHHLHTLNDIRQVYKDAEFTELNKSYRSTFEIMSFAKSIQNNCTLVPVERHGEKPAVTACDNESDKICKLKKALQKFQETKNVSLGIILKTASDAAALYELLSKEFPVHLITPESTSFQHGISVTSVQMSKGLEFDEVLIPDAGSCTYKTEYDRNLLYIACTRAMHRLTLLHTKKMSRFVERALHHIL
ncbi:HelD family protein [Anaerostipes sp.]|uniref:HelD family protein n=1 Tax=Anaerostipes sp. TaxID=1872530 RepID=UPI0025C57584|nr:ATP-binding domain-containing protein [Anaerostipes sp.]MBS7009549.1 ATP-binding domain-containing protein [Anaerostipes sp.]